MPTRGNPTVQVRLAPADRKRWDAAAQAAGKSLSEWVRECCEARIKRGGR